MFILKPNYDVFISFKNLDAVNNPTPDSLLAKKIYDYFSEHNLDTFFSNATLEKRGVAEFMKAINDALDTSKILIVVGTTSDNLQQPWVSREYESFYNDILSGVKPNGKIFGYIDGIPNNLLPRILRENQIIIHKEGSIEQLYNFVINALHCQDFEKYDAMLSYSQTDTDIALILNKKLKQDTNLNIFLDEWDLGRDPPLQKNQMDLDKTKFYAVLMGSGTPEIWFKNSLKRALSHMKHDNEFRVLPVLLEGSPSIETNDFPELRSWVDFKNGIDNLQEYQKLKSGLMGTVLEVKNKMNFSRHIDQHISQLNVELAVIEGVKGIIRPDIYRDITLDTLRTHMAEIRRVFDG
jgi:hypothetical protein